ncbi:uncharacterized protein [Diadema antillarum]|uniref:uncharacterized protein n=1 Tax=Diadema antillarum TaxID=105358 RepID=UPI003A843B94
MSSTDAQPTGRGIVWMVPRTTSTAFAKCMTGIPGCEIWFEPFLFCFIAQKEMEKAGIEDVPMSYKGNEEAYQSVVEKVSDRLFTPDVIPEKIAYATIQKEMEKSESRYVFSKDESFAMQSSVQRRYLPSGYRHAFLIRHPILVFESMRKTGYKALKGAGMLKYNEDESSFDVREYDEDGMSRVFQGHHDLWKYIRENVDSSPVVISSTDLLSNPERLLPKFCEAMGYPYSESLLSWDASPDVCKTWRAPSERFQENREFLGASMSSSHFTPPRPVPEFDTLTDDIKEIITEAMPYYQEMYEHRLTI